MLHVITLISKDDTIIIPFQHVLAAIVLKGEKETEIMMDGGHRIFLDESATAVFLKEYSEYCEWVNKE